MRGDAPRTRRWARALVALLVAPLLVAAAPAGGPPSPAGERSVEVRANWMGPSLALRTTPSLQVVVNPLFRRGSPIHAPLFRALADLGADQVRFVPWLPYPKLAVAALEPPDAQRTFWDFSLIDPIVVDFLAAMQGRDVMMNFSVIPQWMFVTDAPVPYPSDPDAITWTYQRGTELRDASGRELAEYYERLLAWYTQGGFVDERGVRHRSPHRYRFAAWEVFNEPNVEHAMTPQQYTARYDAIAEAVRRVDPTIQLAGPAIAFPLRHLDFLEYFLDPANHRPGVPLDILTYHHYAFVAEAQLADGVCPADSFQQNEALVAGARRIEAMRRRLRPKAQTAINEIGALALEEVSQQTPGHVARPIDGRWWNLSAALFAHQFATLSLLGIDVVGQSAFAQYPGQYPSVSMLDWETGRPNARYWVLKMLIDHLRHGDRLVQTTSTPRFVHAQGFRGPDQRRLLLLVNKCNAPVSATIAGAAGGTALQVETAFDPPRAFALAPGEALRLAPYGVALVTLAAEPTPTP